MISRMAYFKMKEKGNKKEAKRLQINKGLDIKVRVLSATVAANQPMSRMSFAFTARVLE